MDEVTDDDDDDINNKFLVNCFIEPSPKKDTFQMWSVFLLTDTHSFSSRGVFVVR